jgi:OTU domain-containing protein 4
MVEIDNEEAAEERLKEFGYKIKKIPKDGSCLFRAVAEQLFLTQVYHSKVRQQCVDFIELHRDKYINWIDESEKSFEDYCASMRNDSVWGGQVEVDGMSQLYKCTIIVFSARGIEAEHVYKLKDRTRRTVRLCYTNGNHYDSVYTPEFFEYAGVAQSIIIDTVIPFVMDGVGKTGTLKDDFRNLEYDRFLRERRENERKGERFAIDNKTYNTRSRRSVTRNSSDPYEYTGDEKPPRIEKKPRLEDSMFNEFDNLSNVTVYVDDSDDDMKPRARTNPPPNKKVKLDTSLKAFGKKTPAKRK